MRGDDGYFRNQHPMATLKYKLSRLWRRVTGSDYRAALQVANALGKANYALHLQRETLTHEIDRLTWVVGRQNEKLVHEGQVNHDLRQEVDIQKKYIDAIEGQHMRALVANTQCLRFYSPSYRTQT